MLLGPTGTGTTGTSPMDLPDQISQSSNPTEVSSLLESSDQGSEDQGGGESQSGSSGKNSKGGAKVDPSMRYIDATPVSLEQRIDEPVTSGGDTVTPEPGGPK